MEQEDEKMKKRGEKRGAKSVVSNLWVAVPLGVEQTFHRSFLIPSETIDIYIYDS